MICYKSFLVRSHFLVSSPTSTFSCGADVLKIVRTESSQSIFLPGSTSPSAILFEASQLFSQRSPKADEFIRSIRGELGAAVDGCIDAAGREWDIEWQKKLLQVNFFTSSLNSDSSWS